MASDQAVNGLLIEIGAVAIPIYLVLAAVLWRPASRGHRMDRGKLLNLSLQDLYDERTALRRGELAALVLMVVALVMAVVSAPTAWQIVSEVNPNLRLSVTKLLFLFVTVAWIIMTVIAGFLLSRNLQRRTTVRQRIAKRET